MGEEGGKHPVYRWMIPILLLAFLLRVACLDTQSIWYDEAFYAAVSNVDLSSLLDVILDVRLHPPLYFLVLHLWLGLGHGEFVLRALSAFAGILTVAGMYPLGTTIGGKRLGVLSAFALAISPFHIWYSQEVKMCTLITFLVLMSYYFLLRLLEEDTAKNWFGYGVFTLLAVYTHYFALLTMVAQMTCLTLLRRRHRAMLTKWMVCSTIIGLLYAPWLAAVFLTGGFYQGSISWIPAARPADLFWTIYNFGFGSTLDNTHPLSLVAGLLVVLVLIYVSLQLRSRENPLRQRDKLSLVWLWLFLPLLLVLLISLDWPLPQKRSIYMDRYLILLLPAFVVLVWQGIVQLYHRKKAFGALVATALIVSCAVSISALFLDEKYQREQWRQAIAEVKQNAQSRDVLLVRPHQHAVLYYYNLQEIPWSTVPYLGSQQEYDDYLDDTVPAQLSGDGRIWTLIVCENANAHHFVQNNAQNLMDKVLNDELRAWLLAHYQLLDERTYRGIYLASYGTRERM
jgi:mannosyltransferase